MSNTKSVKLTVEQVEFVVEILSKHTMKQVRAAMKAHDTNMEYRYARNYAERKLNKATLAGEIHNADQAKAYFDTCFTERRAELRKLSS